MPLRYESDPKGERVYDRTTTGNATGKEAAQRMWETADRLLDEVDRAHVFEVLRKPCLSFHGLHESEVATGRMLGTGGYSNVYEVTGILPQRSNEKDDSSDRGPDIQTERSVLAKRATRNGHCRYALKRLRSDLDNDLQYARGAIDLAIEIKFLSVLVHPNIVKLRAVSSGTPRVSLDTFLVLDRLYGTLEDKMEDDWIPTHRRLLRRRTGIVRIASTCFHGLARCWCGSDGPRKNHHHQQQHEKTVTEVRMALRELLKTRLLVLYDLSQAFRYMHELRLVYRDIKPQNIGFDVRGDVKVFDFGLMKSLDEHLRSPDGDGYHLTGFTGSIPYMAPEVGLRKPYDVRADVFSYSMLSWEIISLEFLFPSYTIKDYFLRVCKNGERPVFEPSRIWSSVPAVLQTICREGWDETPANRPGMNRIGTRLRGALNQLVVLDGAEKEDGGGGRKDPDEGKQLNSGSCEERKVGGKDGWDEVQRRTQHMMDRSLASIHGKHPKPTGTPEPDTSLKSNISGGESPGEQRKQSAHTAPGALDHRLGGNTVAQQEQQPQRSKTRHVAHKSATQSQLSFIRGESVHSHAIIETNRSATRAKEGKLRVRVLRSGKDQNGL